MSCCRKTGIPSFPHTTYPTLLKVSWPHFIPIKNTIFANCGSKMYNLRINIKLIVTYRYIIHVIIL